MGDPARLAGAESGWRLKMQRQLGWAPLVGGLILVAGGLASLLLAGAVTRAYLNGIFSIIVTETPVNRFAALRCPRLLGRREATTISVVIRNPVSSSLEYAVQAAGAGFRVDAPASDQRVIVPGGQTVSLVWQVTPLGPGDQAIIAQAVSAADSALPGPFHLWPTSFRESCGVLVLDLTLSEAQVVGLCIVSLLTGVVLIYPWLISRRQSVPRGKKSG
jgi:hypothetical protein